MATAATEASTRAFSCMLVVDWGSELGGGEVSVVDVGMGDDTEERMSDGKTRPDRKSSSSCCFYGQDLGLGR